MLITIAIPTYEMQPNGVEFLEFSLNKLAKQTYTNFEVIISDHSQDDLIKETALKWSKILRINYIKKGYMTDNPSSNLNNIIQNAQGQYIKILFQDDFFFDDFSLQVTVDKIVSANFPAWLVSSSQHSSDCINMIRPYYPRYNNKIHLGINTISSPSVLTIKNDVEKIYFNENFKWLMDCIYYKDCFIKFGNPAIIEEITVVNRLWSNQLTNQLSQLWKENEILNASKMYDNFMLYNIYKIRSLLKGLIKKVVLKAK